MNQPRNSVEQCIGIVRRHKQTIFALPRNFDYRLADRSRELTIAEWERLGVRRPGGQAFPRTGDRAPSQATSQSARRA